MICQNKRKQRSKVKKIKMQWGVQKQEQGCSSSKEAKAQKEEEFSISQ